MFNIILIIFFNISCLFAVADDSTPIDLETFTQDFVLETKQLKIPGYPTACNPSIIRWSERLLLSFDAYSEENAAPDQVGLVYLDDEFNLVGSPHILPLPKNLWQDARLITVENCLYLIFNGAIESGVRRMFITQVLYNGVKFSINTPEPLLHFPGEHSGNWERNWIPFVYRNTLFLTSNLIPHQILRPLLGTQQCEEISSTPFLGRWDWGALKPGTAAQLDGDHYLAIFHSSKVMTSIHSNNQLIQHYFMGAYTFDSEPPFAIAAISQNPIIGKNFYHGSDYKMTKPCRVVFPCGFVLDEKYVWIVFGRQDHEIWMAKLDKKGLYQSLVSLHPK